MMQSISKTTQGLVRMLRPTFRLVCSFVLATFIGVSAHAQTSSAYVKRDAARKDVIVFVHGVTGDAKETWTNERTKAYWPNLIREDQLFADANVWVFSYFTPKLQNAQNVEELARKLGDEMRAQDIFKNHNRLYFVAHSMGGLITREMLTQQLPPPSKVPLIFFFGTPSAGADSAGVAAAISSNPQFQNMRPFTRESDVSNFSKRWLSTAENENARYPQKIWSFCAYEIDGFVSGKLIVNAGSASFLCSTSPRASRGNHVTMVKPADREDESYQYFVSAYKFSRSPSAQFVSSNAAITLHSSGSPGLRIEGLELRVAKIIDNPIRVGCNQVEIGEKRVRLPLMASERLVAVKPSVDSMFDIQTTSVSSSFDPSGSITVGYRVEGKPESPVTGCVTRGSASLEVQYLIEHK